MLKQKRFKNVNTINISIIYILYNSYGTW